MSSLSGKVALIAGGAGTVGSGIVRALVNRGATVIVPSRCVSVLAYFLHTLHLLSFSHIPSFHLFVSCCVHAHLRKLASNLCAIRPFWPIFNCTVRAGLRNPCNNCAPSSRAKKNSCLLLRATLAMRRRWKLSRKRCSTSLVPLTTW